MKPFLVLVLIYFFSGIVFAQEASDEHLRVDNDYKTALLELGSNYKAKLYCSCLYQMKQGRPYCKKFISVDPEIFSVSSNDNKKTTSVRALFFMTPGKAKFVSDEVGCILTK